MATIGQRIVALRTARGLSQPELARRVGIKQPSLHNIESGKTVTLRGATLAGLCKALSVTPDMILKGGVAQPNAEEMLFEQELISAWRGMSRRDQEHLIAIARALVSKPAGPGHDITTHQRVQNEPAARQITPKVET